MSPSEPGPSRKGHTVSRTRRIIAAALTAATLFGGLGIAAAVAGAPAAAASAPATHSWD